MRSHVIGTLFDVNLMQHQCQCLELSHFREDERTQQTHMRSISQQPNHPVSRLAITASDTIKSLALPKGLSDA